MTTIHKEITRIQGEAVCAALDIDPDLPAEWATVDRCLTWLRENFEAPEKFVMLDRPPQSARKWRVILAQPDHFGLRSHRLFDAPTLHAALIAACKAVQEAAA